MTVAEMVKSARVMWALATDTEIKIDDSWFLFREAVRHVEAVDYPTSITTVDADGYKWMFSSTPSAISERLYILKSIQLFELSDQGKKLLKDLGISFKSGPDSLSTTKQADARAGLLKTWKDEYAGILRSAKSSQIASGGATSVDLYSVTDSNLTTTN